MKFLLWAVYRANKMVICILNFVKTKLPYEKTLRVCLDLDISKHFR